MNFTDDLKNIYIKAGKVDAFFDQKTPISLWRAQSNDDFKKEVFLMRPHPGYEKKDANGNVIGTRLPDVKIVERSGQLFVLGCSTISGSFRGISLSDKRLPFKGIWYHYLIPADTPIPPGLMITRDNLNQKTGITHYTIGPKNDMPLELFLATLKIVANVAKRID